MGSTTQNAQEVNNNMTFQIRPEVLDKIRTEQELPSDEALARHLGVTLGTVQGLRRGRTPSVPTLVRVMQAANIQNIATAVTENNTAAA